MYILCVLVIRIWWLLSLISLARNSSTHLSIARVPEASWRTCLFQDVDYAHFYLNYDKFWNERMVLTWQTRKFLRIFWWWNELLNFCDYVLMISGFVITEFYDTITAYYYCGVMYDFCVILDNNVDCMWLVFSNHLAGRISCARLGNWANLNHLHLWTGLMVTWRPVQHTFFHHCSVPTRPAV